MESVSAAIANGEVLGRFTPREREQLARLAVRRSLEKEQLLFLQGEPAGSVLVIAEGALRSVIHAPDGRQHVISGWEAGEEFWCHTLLDGEPMPSSLEAARPSVVYEWSGEVVLGMVVKNPDTVRALLRRQTRLLRRRRAMIYELAFHPVAGRLARLILERFTDSSADTVQRDMTLDEMAAMIAASPEVVCRVLYQFQSEGIISLGRTHITLTNRDALQALIPSA